MWIGVRQRFTTFNAELALTPDQVEDGETKHHGVRKCLNRHYYDSSSETDNSFLIGSWGKDTRVRPPRDVDLYFVLPHSVYQKFENYSGNKQSALLQEVKGVLQATYSSTDMSGDGQVVLVKFNTINIEVVPVFLLTNGRYWVPHTHDGGFYKEADPNAELASISAADIVYNLNVRRLVRMLKAWQWWCDVPIKSFYIEILVPDFLQGCLWSKNDYFWYDWLLRDFFTFLKTKKNLIIFAPGTYELLYLGEDWFSKCETAEARAIKACDYERDDHVALAGEEWQKIFGPQIPRDP